MPIERTLGRLVFGFDMLAFRLPLPTGVDRAEAFLLEDVGLSTPVAGTGGDARVVKVWSGEDEFAADGDAAPADGRRDGPFRFFALMVDSSALLGWALLLSWSARARASGGKRFDQVWVNRLRTPGRERERLRKLTALLVLVMVLPFGAGCTGSGMPSKRRFLSACLR